MEDTKIAWTDHTFNPWCGCQAVSPGCDNCYAAAMTNRWGGDFSKRRRTSEAYWKKPLAWNRKAERDGTRPRVLCGSMCDWLDSTVSEEWRADLWSLIFYTPNLDWLLLTKRSLKLYANEPRLHFGITAENQEWLDRRMEGVGYIKKVFISAEPLLGLLDISEYHKRISWIIIGCEKIGCWPGRLMWDIWLFGLIRQASSYGIPVFIKQMVIDGKVTQDVTQFPEWAQRREFP